MSLCLECCVLSGRGLGDGLIPCKVESYFYRTLFCFVFCKIEFSASG